MNDNTEAEELKKAAEEAAAVAAKLAEAEAEKKRIIEEMAKNLGT